MKKLVPFLLCSTAAAICLEAVSASGGYLTPRVPPVALRQPAAKTSGEARHATRDLTTVWTVTTLNDAGPGSLR